jgi:hypothetical protein
MRVLALLVTAAALLAGAEAAAPAAAELSFDDFLDSLRTRSAAAITREGVREEWPAADSLAALARARGPAFADSAARHGARPLRLDFEHTLTTFNRVEGLRDGAGLRIAGGPLALRPAAAYGLSSHDWRHREELRLDAGSYGTFTVTFADLVVAFGAGPVRGNGFYALLAGADDQDYLRRRGAAVEWRRRAVRVAFEVADERSAEAATDWNLAGRERGPRPNPPIAEGRARRLVLEASSAFEIQRLSGAVLRGAVLRWRAQADISGYGLGGDFDYDRYRLDLVSDLHGPGRDDLRLTLAAGGARNGPPVQALHYLGGPAALRAYPVNALAGDRMLYGALDYLVGTDLLARAGLPWVQLQVAPFFEIGAAWPDVDGRGLFSRPRSADWRSDAGIALQRNVLAGISTRLDLAVRLDRARDRLTTRFGFWMPLFDRLGAGDEP